MQWYALAEQTERQGMLLANRTESAYSFFMEAGFAPLVLKGNGMAQLYPHPLRRQGGDIDIWLDGGRRRICAFAKKCDKEGRLYGVNYLLPLPLTWCLSSCTVSAISLATA